MKKVVAVLLILAAAGAAAFQFFRQRTGADGALRLSGNVEATEVELGFQVAGRLAERAVEEGQPVRQGQLVARLDPTDFETQVAARRAEVDGARAALAELLTGSRPEEIAEAEAAAQRAEAALDTLLAGSRPQEVQGAAASVEQLRADAERLLIDAERQRNLYAAGLVTARENETAQTAYRVALNRLREADERRKLVVEGPRAEEIRGGRAALAEARQRLALVRKGPRRETVDQARARLKQAAEALSLAQTVLGYATLASPLSGLVLSKNAEPGEYVAPGTPVVTVADLGRVWLRVYVPETELGRVRVGQPVRVTADTDPGKTYQGRLSFLSSQAEFTPKSVQTPKERVKLVYRAKIEIPNPAQELKPGMPADAVIETANHR